MFNVRPDSLFVNPMKTPLLIGIGGAHSATGKTTLASGLINHFCRSGLKGAGTRWGAVKVTKTDIYVFITDDPEILGKEEKDTCRMLEAGAKHVVWVQSPPEKLQEALPIAMDLLPELDGVIIEGNSAIEFLKPDIVIFLNDGEDALRIKPGAVVTRQKADLVLAGCSASGEFGFGTDHVVKRIEAVLMEKDIREKLTERAVEGKLTCPEARKIAEELGVPYREVGQTANALKIKIKNCELGCF